MQVAGGFCNIRQMIIHAKNSQKNRWKEFAGKDNEVTFGLALSRRNQILSITSASAFTMVMNFE